GEGNSGTRPTVEDGGVIRRGARGRDPPQTELGARPIGRAPSFACTRREGLFALGRPSGGSVALRTCPACRCWAAASTPAPARPPAHTNRPPLRRRRSRTPAPDCHTWRPCCCTAA